MLRLASLARLGEPRRSVLDWEALAGRLMDEAARAVA
jgi:hypothetical protein